VGPAKESFNLPTYLDGAVLIVVFVSALVVVRSRRMTPNEAAADSPNGSTV
jgi:hypothetical protein